MKHINKALIIVAVILIAVVVIKLNDNSYEYKFILDGEELDSILQCENYWHYDQLDFIPCIYNNTPVALMRTYLNYSQSPIANCEELNATFPGFNTMNETKAKELYDSVMPKCLTITTEIINKDFLSNFDCIRAEGESCYEWQKEDLIIRKI